MVEINSISEYTTSTLMIKSFYTFFKKAQDYKKKNKNRKRNGTSNENWISILNAVHLIY